MGEANGNGGYSPRGGGEPKKVWQALENKGYSPRGGGKSAKGKEVRNAEQYSPRCEGEPCALYTKWVIENDILPKIN